MLNYIGAFSTHFPHLGETNRFFYGQEIVARLPAITISRLQGLDFGDEVELSGGDAHGVIAGSEYAVVPFEANEVPQYPTKLVVERTMSVYSVASIRTSNNEGKGQLIPGCQLVLVSLPYDTSCKVRLCPELAAERDSFIREWEAKCGDDNWLQLAKDDADELSTFQVSLDENGAYQILDGHGAKWPNITPPLPATSREDPLAIQIVLSRLRHLARFLAVKRINNTNLTSGLRNRISFEVSRHDPEGKKSQPPTIVGGEYVVKHGDFIDLHVKNISDKPVAFVLLNLQPLYGITKVYPAKGHFECLDSNRDWKIPKIKMTIAPDLLRLKARPSSGPDILSSSSHLAANHLSALSCRVLLDHLGPQR
jgi:hypothetical protein